MDHESGSVSTAGARARVCVGGCGRACTYVSTYVRTYYMYTCIDSC